MTVQLRFAGHQREAASVNSFWFEPLAPLHFEAGQTVRIELPHAAVDDRGAARTFSIASAPAEPRIRLTTRFSSPSSSFKRALAVLEPGTVVTASGPNGRFTFHDTDQPTVFIAGGIGITPFRAILPDLAGARRSAEVSLLYSNATPDIPFRGFLDALEATWPELRVVYTITRPSGSWSGATGRIDRSFVERHVPYARRATYYVCGPTPMVQSLRDELGQLGIDPSRIRHEGFPGYEMPEPSTAAAVA
jgi:ferredoxin-NADP reductase